MSTTFTVSMINCPNWVVCQRYSITGWIHSYMTPHQLTSLWEARGDNIALLRRRGYWCCQLCLWLFHIAAKCSKIHDPSVSFTACFNQDWLHLLQGLFPIRQPLRSIKRWLNTIRTPNPPLLSGWPEDSEPAVAVSLTYLWGESLGPVLLALGRKCTAQRWWHAVSPQGAWWHLLYPTSNNCRD